MKISDNILGFVKQDLSQLDKNLHKMIVAEHPILYAAAEHLFNAGGKRIRPAIIFFVAQTTMNSKTILNEHKRLAEITEIIHTASLVHDDVIDECQMRRGQNTVHNEFSTKIAVLAGDYLFAQSSWYLANLNNVEVVKTISKVITDFAEGEVRQGLTNFDYTISIDSYIEKSFYKTASLIAASCTGTAMLSNIKTNQLNVFYLYGKHTGLAFQIIDDILDITSSTSQLGKPSGLDLQNGNLTAPILFALDENPIIYELINREFKNKNDLQKAIELIKETNGVQKAKDLAREHIQLAINILQKVDSDYDIYNLILISNYIINRIN